MHWDERKKRANQEHCVEGFHVLAIFYFILSARSKVIDVSVEVNCQN